MSRVAKQTENGSASTVDSILRGSLDLEQPSQGYRFNIDAVLLADFASSSVVKPPKYVVDLGAGCGVVGLILARKWPEARIALVELQTDLAEHASRNIQRNELEGRVQVYRADLRHWLDWPAAQGEDVLVVTNPPFFRVDSSRLSPNQQLAMARHELSCTLSELIEASSRNLLVNGGLALIHDASRAGELESLLHQQGFSTTRRRFVHPYQGKPMSRVLIYAQRTNEPQITRDQKLLSNEDSPLYIGEGPGVYSPEVRAMLGD